MVSLTVILFIEEMLISTVFSHVFMPNLIKTYVTVSSTQDVFKQRSLFVIEEIL